MSDRVVVTVQSTDDEGHQHVTRHEGDAYVLLVDDSEGGGGTIGSRGSEPGVGAMLAGLVMHLAPPNSVARAVLAHTLMFGTSRKLGEWKFDPAEGQYRPVPDEEGGS